MQITLTVPNSPENFPCSKCKPGELTVVDEHTVVINQKADSIKGLASFYWGIDAHDPRGQYKLQLSFDGALIDTYSFEVK